MLHPNNKEINTLLRLVDDPDLEVFETVSGKLLGYGKQIIPQLEAFWENHLEENVQGRIETLIHRLQFQDLQQRFDDWAQSTKGTLLEGAMLIAAYRYPDLDDDLLLSEIKQIEKNIWLELNHYLSPLEQVNVVNSILYSYYKIQGEEKVNKDTDLFCLNHLLESKRGNSFTIGILYLTICESLDIPIFAVDLPRQFVLAYFDNLYHFLSPQNNPVQTIQFYLDPINGMVYTHNDIRVYLKKINELDYDKHTRPMLNKEVIYKMLGELATTYKLQSREVETEEIQTLAQILKANLSL